MRRAAEEVVHQLAKALGAPAGTRSAVKSLEEPASLMGRDGRPHVVASFDVEGLGELCSLRLALPTGLLDGASPEDSGDEPRLLGDLEGQVREMPVSLRVDLAQIDFGVVDSKLAGQNRFQPDRGGDETWTIPFATYIVR